MEEKKQLIFTESWSRFRKRSLGIGLIILMIICYITVKYLILNVSHTLIVWIQIIFLIGLCLYFLVYYIVDFLYKFDLQVYNNGFIHPDPPFIYRFNKKPYFIDYSKIRKVKKLKKHSKNTIRLALYYGKRKYYLAIRNENIEKFYLILSKNTIPIEE